MQNYERIGKIYDLESIFSLILTPYDKEWSNRQKRKQYRKLFFVYNEQLVTLKSVKLKVFKNNIYCSLCGLKGLFFAIEKIKNKKIYHYHFNLYGLDSKGCEVLFNIDHIFPKSKGGESKFHNYQTTCEKCNSLKADVIY